MLYLDDAPYSHTFNRKTANPDGKPILLFDAAKNILDINDVVALTGLSKSYVYKLTCRKEIPYYTYNMVSPFYRSVYKHSF
jgi:hypothetical protein